MSSALRARLDRHVRRLGGTPADALLSDAEAVGEDTFWDSETRESVPLLAPVGRRTPSVPEAVRWLLASDLAGPFAVVEDEDDGATGSVSLGAPSEHPQAPETPEARFFAFACEEDAQVFFAVDALARRADPPVWRLDHDGSGGYAAFASLTAFLAALRPAGDDAPAA